jgi:hypothetical protein
MQNMRKQKPIDAKRTPVPNSSRSIALRIPKFAAEGALSGIGSRGPV